MPGRPPVLPFYDSVRRDNAHGRHAGRFSITTAMAKNQTSQHVQLAGLLAAALLASSAGYAQCTMVDQSTCASIYSNSTNPALAVFLANVQSSFQAINAATAVRPQPRITVTAQILPASGAWFSSSVQAFGPAINGYMDLLKNSAGVTTQDVNLWPSVLSAASQYSPGAGDITIASDCAGGVQDRHQCLRAPRNRPCHALCRAHLLRLHVQPRRGQRY